MNPRRGTAQGLIGGGPATGIGLAAVVSAAVSYVVLLLAARTLSPEDNAIFLVYWALLFGTFGLIGGLYPEAARASYSPQTTLYRSCPRTVPVAVTVSFVLCCTLGLSGSFWSARLLGERNTWLAGVVLVAAVAYSAHFAFAGVLTARRQWRALIAATSCEASVRLACVLVAASTGASLGSMAVASAASAAAWVLMLFRRDVRAAFGARGDAPLLTALKNYGQACAAGAASAALIVGFPVLVRLTTSSDEYLGSAGLLLAISLTRAPLMVPLNAYQGVAITYFLRHRDRGPKALYPIVAAVLLLTFVLGVAAAVAGPWLFTLLLGDRYAVGAGVLAGLTAGAGLLALLTLTGACCLAVGSHAGYAAGWLTATVVALLLLMMPLVLTTRVVLSLLIAPGIGCLVHAVAIRTAHGGRSVDDGHPAGGQAVQ